MRTKRVRYVANDVSVVGPGRFSQLQGYMLLVIHPVILECNRTTSKYPRKFLVDVNISFLFVYAGCDQSVFWYATEHLCVCEKKERGSLEFCKHSFV